MSRRGLKLEHDATSNGQLDRGYEPCLLTKDQLEKQFRITGDVGNRDNRQLSYPKRSGVLQHT